jgi:hypothetical protein
MEQIVEPNFEPTVRHTTYLRFMDDKTKASLKSLVSILGYYHSIQVLVSECGKSQREAKILADIGCFMLD